MGKETSQRIQTSILNNVEKKVLVWLAQRQPKWVTSDFLTYIGVLGSLLFMIGGGLANIDADYLWLSSLGLVLHWYGDSLDGTLARVRDTQRPVYGFFIDHTLDVMTTVFICIGAGLSPMFRMDVALLVLAGYLSLSVYTYIGIILKNEFNLTYGKFGPTEFRLLLVLMCILYMCTSLSDFYYDFDGCTLGIFDFFGIIISVMFFLIYSVRFWRDRYAFAQCDPLKKS